MTWWNGSAVGLDFETDDVDPTDARIVTAATVTMEPGSAPLDVEIMAKPERPIPDEAAGIHGITTERAEAEGQDRLFVVGHVVDALVTAGPDCPVVGHNLAYDLTVLDREMRRTGGGYLSTQGPGHEHSGFVVITVDGKRRGCFPVIDTMVIDKYVDKYRPGKGERKLTRVAEVYGVPMEEGAAHGATADVVASLRVAIAIARRSALSFDELVSLYADRKRPATLAGMFGRLGTYDLAELHRAQRLWSLEQAEGLRDYFVKLNDPEKDPATVDGRWPLRPIAVTDAVTTTAL